MDGDGVSVIDSAIVDFTYMVGDIDVGDYRGSCSLRELVRTQELKNSSQLLQSSSSCSITDVDSVSVERVGLEKHFDDSHHLFQGTLMDFILAFMVEQPKDVIDFAVQHFKNLQDYRKRKSNSIMEKSFSDDVVIPTMSSAVSNKSKKAPKEIRRLSVCAEQYNQSDLEDDDDDISDEYDRRTSCRLSLVIKSREQSKRILSVIKDILIFRDLDSKQLITLLESMFPMHVYSGDVVVRYGEECKNFYVIETGTFNVLDKYENIITTMENKGTFGELALLHNTTSTETIVATSEGFLWVVDHSSFRRTLLQHSYRKQKLYQELVESVPMFKELHPFEIINLAEVLKPMKFKMGASVMKQGDEADGMYFIEEGKVSIWRDPDVSNTKSKGERLLGTLGKGQYFGEIALILNRQRNASVYAETDLTLAFLDKNSFERLLGKCIDILNRGMEDYNLKDPGLIAYLAEVKSKKSLEENQ